MKKTDEVKMTKQKFQGQCLLCQQVIGKKALFKHLQNCIGIHKNKPNKKKCFHILVEGKYEPEYWLHVAVGKETKLKQLDQFLRDIWLECCGHLSDFKIEGVEYAAFPSPEFDQESMNKALKNVLEPKMKFIHTYDYGSTTQLILKVIGEQDVALRKSVELLARNEPPLIPCENCGEFATQLCEQCIYENKGWVCEKCIDDHECGEEMMLPVVNSPRVGVCGYTGEPPESEETEWMPDVNLN